MRLLTCVERNDVAGVAFLLEAGVSPYCEGDCPILMAIFYNHVECAKLLFRYMKPLDVISTCGARCVTACVKFRCTELFKYFLQFENMESMRKMYMVYKYYVYTGVYENMILQRAREEVWRLYLFRSLPKINLCEDVLRLVAEYVTYKVDLWFFRKSKDYFVGDGRVECLKRMNGRWFLKCGHWYECTLSGEIGLVKLDSMNIHENVVMYSGM